MKKKLAKLAQGVAEEPQAQEEEPQAQEEEPQAQEVPQVSKRRKLQKKSQIESGEHSHLHI